MAFTSIQIGAWLIEVDREATQAAYSHENPISACICDYCQNYFVACQASTAYSLAGLALFERLGIAPEKEAEVYAMYANEEKTQAYYGGWYHFVGRLLESAEKPDDYTQVDGSFEVSFAAREDLLSSRFPRPVLQMEFLSFIPWMLEAKRQALDDIT